MVWSATILCKRRLLQEIPVNYQQFNTGCRIGTMVTQVVRNHVAHALGQYELPAMPGCMLRWNIPPRAAL